MADLDIQKFAQELAQLGVALGGSRASVQSVGQSMARLRVEMQRGTGTIQSNAAALQRLMSDFDDLQDSAKQSADGQKLLAESTRMASQIMRDAGAQLTAGVIKGGLVEAIDYVSKQIFTTVRSYQEGASGIQTAFNIQNAALESQIKILDRLSQGATVAAETLALIPGARLAAGLAGLVAGATGLAKNLDEIKLQAFQNFQKEVTETTVTFDAMTKSGALFTYGFTGMREASGALQLNLNEFAKTVGQNKLELTNFGGSIIGGVKRLKNVGDAFTRLASQGTDLRKELEYAGYSAQEQVDGITDFMDMMNKAGRLRGMTDTEIAKQGTEYLKNLRAISAFTGEDVKQAQKRAQQASEQLAVQAKLNRQGPQAFERFTTAVASMGPEIQKGLQQMTAFDGTIVDKNLNQLLAVSPTRKRLLEETYADMQNSALGAEEVNKRYQQRVAEYGDALKQEALAAGETYGTITLATGAQGEVTSMLEKQAELGRKGEAARAAEVKALGDTTAQLSRLITEGLDPFRDSVIAAERANRERLPYMINQMTGITEAYVRTLQPAEMLQKQFEQMKNLMTESLKYFATSDMFAKPGGSVAGIMTSTAELLLKGVKTLDLAAGKLLDFAKELPQLPNKIREGFKTRDLGTLGMTGSMFEKQDFFGKVAAGETVLTPNQLENLVKGVSASGITSGRQTAAEQSNNMSAILDKMSSVTSIPVPEIKAVPRPEIDNLQAVGNQLKESFAQSMANFQQQKLQVEAPKINKDDTEANKLVEKIQEVFTGQNGFNQMLSNLKGQLEIDNGKQIAVLQEQVTKLEDLLSAMQDNVDYSKRIADNIA